MKALKNSLIRAQNLFSTMHPSHFIANAKLSATAVQTLRLQLQSCEGMVPKNLRFALHEPIFQLCKGI
jgi:hypothetical protein